ncbi:hypothetical protein OG439_38500 [Amycolatopsis sp. NBC_01307]|uniref:hypothetical protein n=1 Tax=Amycolatopsis sp. NBC_01307 TaxID=2903561 RepID=UPI002E11800D|nr:hypothetical protein OG439_38500 [Amycolatopsis sp. NBC_01307]
MTAPGFTTTSGVALAPAPPEPGPDGTPVTRVGLWAVDTGRGPVALAADEVALAIAHGGHEPSQYTLLVDESARQALAGLATLGRTQLRALAARHRHGDSDVWPGHSQRSAQRCAAKVCKTAHRDR